MQNCSAFAMLGRNVNACFVVVIQSLQRGMENVDKVHDESIQCVIGGLVSKLVGPTFSAGQTVQGRTVARFRKETDISASTI